MADYRTKRQKLEAMANQTESPQEAEVARKKLAAMGDAPPPRSGERVRSTTWDSFFYEDILREMNDQMAARMRRQAAQFYGGWFGRQAKPSGYERQGARAEYLYADDFITKEDLERARDSMKGPQVMSKDEADRQAEAMYQEIRRRQEAARMSRDDWRREYRTPWGYEDKESDDE